nr:HEAT repeat domain-containing protein [Deinococcus sp. JMULE3]
MIVGDAPTSFLNEVLIAPFPDDLKIHACWLLEGWGDASSLLALQQLLHSPAGSSVKQAALLPLAMIKDVSVDDVLLEATLDDDEAVTELARELLEERRR